MSVKPRNSRRPQARQLSATRQAGLTLMEAIIGMAISTIVTLSMIGLMGNSMGASTRIILMSQLTDELRNAMSMMTRDVRRANYSATSLYCYSNADCGIDGSASQSADVTISDDGECFVFWLDRNFDGDASNDGAGGFRRVVDNGRGRLDVWVGDSDPDCDQDDADWVELTDSTSLDITAFTVDDSASFQQTLTQPSGSLTQRTRSILFQVEGRLIRDNTISRRIEDRIKVRNDILL